MDLMPYINRLREDLVAAASAGDEQTQRTAAVLGVALEPAARLAIMNALSDLAAEVTAALDDRVVDVRLDGRDVRVVVSAVGNPEADSGSEAAPSSGAGPGPWHGSPAGAGTGSFAELGGDISRMTLRLLDQIKGQAERAAAEQGVSLNAWISQAVQSALRSKHPGETQHEHAAQARHRIHGWVQG